MAGGEDPGGRRGRGLRRGAERRTTRGLGQRSVGSCERGTAPSPSVAQLRSQTVRARRALGSREAEERRGARRSLAPGRAPSTRRTPSSRQPSVQRGCRCPNGGHGLARPGAGEDGVEAAAAAETAAARLGPGREPRGRGARAGPREHVGPERSAGCAAAGTAPLLGPEAEPSR